MQAISSNFLLELQMIFLRTRSWIWVTPRQCTKWFAIEFKRIRILIYNLTSMKLPWRWNIKHINECTWTIALKIHGTTWSTWILIKNRFRRKSNHKREEKSSEKNDLVWRIDHETLIFHYDIFSKDVRRRCGSLLEKLNYDQLFSLLSWLRLPSQQS